MEVYDESRYCAYCNLAFPLKTSDKVEHDGSYYHKRCLEWKNKPRVVQAASAVREA